MRAKSKSTANVRRWTKMVKADVEAAEATVAAEAVVEAESPEAAARTHLTMNTHRRKLATMVVRATRGADLVVRAEVATEAQWVALLAVKRTFTMARDSTTAAVTNEDLLVMAMMVAHELEARTVLAEVVEVVAEVAWEVVNVVVAVVAMEVAKTWAVASVAVVIAVGVTVMVAHAMVAHAMGAHAMAATLAVATTEALVEAGRTKDSEP